LVTLPSLHLVTLLLLGQAVAHRLCFFNAVCDLMPLIASFMRFVLIAKLSFAAALSSMSASTVSDLVSPGADAATV